MDVLSNIVLKKIMNLPAASCGVSQGW